jgi:predicted lipoprotein
LIPARSMATPATRPAPPVWPWIAAGVLFAGLLVAYPPFHIRSRPASGALSTTATNAAGPFDATAFAGKFWAGPLLSAAATAPDAGALVAGLRRNPSATLAGAHRVGLGNVAYFFARGEGRVTAVERSRLLVEIGGEVVAIRTGPVFGNVVRDGSGLLEVNQVPGLAEFNALSAELNRFVEERVQPALKSVPVGATLLFAGCAEAPEGVPDSGPVLTFIPIQAEVKP